MVFLVVFIMKVTFFHIRFFDLFKHLSNVIYIYAKVALFEFPSLILFLIYMME